MDFKRLSAERFIRSQWRKLRDEPFCSSFCSALTNVFGAVRHPERRASEVLQPWHRLPASCYFHTFQTLQSFIVLVGRQQSGQQGHVLPSCRKPSEQQSRHGLRVAGSAGFGKVSCHPWNAVKPLFKGMRGLKWQASNQLEEWDVTSDCTWSRTSSFRIVRIWGKNA